MRKIEAMHAAYGKRSGLKCSQCNHLRRNIYDKIYYKCFGYGDSKCEATDWAKSWTACGLYGKDLPPGWVPMVIALKHAPREKPPDEGPLDGQISIFDAADEP